MENSIKETIKIIERKIKEAEHYSDITGLYLTLDEELRNALMNILLDYKKVLEEANRYKNMYKAEHEIHLVRNEQLDRKENAVTKCNELIIENAKLKEENQYNRLLLDLNNNFTIDKKTGNYKWNVIEIQKIKDKIEEINKMIAYEHNDAVIIQLGKQKRVLQKLLESEE